MEESKSYRSSKSVKSISEVPADSRKVLFDDPFAQNFEENLKKMCINFDRNFDLKVKKDLQRTVELRTSSKRSKSRRLTIIGPVPSEEFTDTDEVTTAVTTATQDSHDDSGVYVTTIYDHMNRLAEVCMTNQKDVPRTVLQVLQILGPLYPFLFRLTFKRCKLNKYCVYEVSKFIAATPITELAFDDSFSRELNYAILLDKMTNLRVLSLARCNINDFVCEQIANKLTYFEPASRNLLVLNLSSNRITDEGAKCFAFVLRTNRNLRHLNLAGNQITDVGAIAILESLMTFPLTYEEYIGKRTRYSEHIKELLELSKSYLEKLTEGMPGVTTEPAKARIDKPKPKKSPTATPVISPVLTPKLDDQLTYYKQRAEMHASDEMGPFIDPFGARSTIFRNGYRYCTGNLTLSSLNLSFNSLCYPSLQKLEEVVKYQRSVRQINQSGLLRPVIEGNYLPVDAVEYKVIADILGRFIGSRPSRKSEMNRKKGRVGSKVHLSTTRD